MLINWNYYKIRCVFILIIFKKHKNILKIFFIEINKKYFINLKKNYSKYNNIKKLLNFILLELRNKWIFNWIFIIIIDIFSENIY